MNKKLVVLTLALCGVAASFADDACVPCEVIDAAKNLLQSLMSCDPNEITGPAGVGEKRYVKQGEWMDYTIYFENKSDATAAAQEIRVTLPKDPRLDWSTLELGEVAFGDNIDSWFAGKAFGENTYAPSGSDTQVKTVVTVTDETVEWYLRSWDPNTPDHFPANVADGFLPPNDPDTHCGEGHVRFRVKVKDDAEIGSKINASATIVFDANPPIMTDPAWWNTVAQMQGVKVTVDDVETTLDLIVGLPYGELPDPGVVPEGHLFSGWFTQPNGKGRQITADSLVEAGDERLYQYWQKNGDSEPPPVDPVATNTITYLGVEGVVNTNVTTFTTNDLPLVLGPVAREGYEFLGWTPNGGVIPSGTTSNVTFMAQWKALGPEPEPEATPAIFDSFAAGAVNEKGATYNGFLGEESFGGTFTLVVKKPKKGETTAAATLTKVNPATGKKEKITGTVDVATGLGAGGLAGLELNEKGVGGKLGDLTAQGAVDAAKAKDQETLGLMNGFDKSVYSVVLKDMNGSCALLTATFSKKGKVKVAGTVDGVKISCSAQMSVGDRYAAVPFAYAKPAKGIAVSAVLWFEKETKALVDVTGAGKDVTAVPFGSASAPALGEYRFLMAEADVHASMPNAISNTAYEVKASFDGKKYDAGKSAKVKYDKKTSTLAVDISKGTDISGLKLKYAKGAISGSFTVYEIDTTKQKLVKNKFTVNGVIVNGVGYGLGTNKKLKPIPIEVVK